MTDWIVLNKNQAHLYNPPNIIAVVSVKCVKLEVLNNKICQLLSAL